MISVWVLNAVTVTALLAGAVGFGFSVWAVLKGSESLGGLWLIFWAIIFVPLFILLGAIHFWRAWRSRPVAEARKGKSSS